MKITKLDHCNVTLDFIRLSKVRGVFWAVLKVFESGFSIFRRCFCMSYLQRVFSIRLSYIRLGMFFFVFKGIFHVCIGF